jgi:hypothetical protein
VFTQLRDSTTDRLDRHGWKDTFWKLRSSISFKLFILVQTLGIGFRSLSNVRRLGSLLQPVSSTAAIKATNRVKASHHHSETQHSISHGHPPLGSADMFCIHQQAMTCLDHAEHVVSPTPHLAHQGTSSSSCGLQGMSCQHRSHENAYVLDFTLKNTWQMLM